MKEQTWRKVLGKTRNVQALRQASPLTPLLSSAARECILSEVSSLKQGLVLGQENAP